MIGKCVKTIKLLRRYAQVFENKQDKLACVLRSLGVVKQGVRVTEQRIKPERAGPGLEMCGQVPFAPPEFPDSQALPQVAFADKAGELYPGLFSFAPSGL